MRFPFEKQRPYALVATLVAVALLVVAPVAEAGAKKKEGRRGRTLIVLRIAEALDLDEDQTLRLGAEYRRFDKRRQELIGERAVTEVELETALGRESPNETDIRRFTDELLGIDKELILMPDALFESLQDMLDTEQRARLALLKIKLQRKIARERSRREGHQPRGGKAKAGPPS